MKSIAIIPARGGSKRIPGKNIRDFLGKPIISYSIDLAFRSELFDEVMVSTDDEKIAEIAIRFGAKVPFVRSKENSNDEATTVSVLLEVLRNYQQNGFGYEMGCCIYPTAPLLKLASLIEGKTKLMSGFDTVFAAVAYSTPILRALTLSPDGLAKMKWPEYRNSRSQDLEPFYQDAGQFYWFRSKALIKHQSLFTENTGAVIIPEMMVQDIDNEMDWKLAELKAQLNG